MIDTRSKQTKILEEETKDVVNQSQSYEIIKDYPQDNSFEELVDEK